MIQKDVIVIGGGAAGMMCALQAAKRGRSVVLIEHQEKVGNKIRISGGGRCNFTNLYSTAENFISQNPHFCKSALSRYTPYHFLEWIEEAGITWHEREEGQLFFDKSAQQLNDLFIQEMKTYKADIYCNTSVIHVSKEGTFRVETTGGVFQSESLVIATGGLSIPKIGATGFGHEIARQFGLAITDLAPALVPFTLNPLLKKNFAPLSGISLPVTVACNEQLFINKLLFTHRGLSGPAILQISSYWSPGDVVAIDLLPGIDFKERLEQANPLLQSDNFLAELIPRRLAKSWSAHYFQARSLRAVSAHERDLLAEKLQNWQLIPGGTEGYRTAEVTRGGVDCRKLSSKTMESREVSGLFFVGEVVDVTGHLGGHNFQWAWASGQAAGRAV